MNFLKTLFKRKNIHEPTEPERTTDKKVPEPELSKETSMEEIRNLIIQGKEFDAAGSLVHFIRIATVAEIKSAAPEIKKWLTEDLRSVYIPPGPYIPGSSQSSACWVNESLWVLEQGGVADKLINAGTLQEIAEALLKEGITKDTSRIEKFLGRNFTLEEIKEQLLTHAGSCQYFFGRSEADRLKQLPLSDQKEIIRAAVKRAVSLGWWDIVRDLRGVTYNDRGIEHSLVNHILNTYFPEYS